MKLDFILVGLSGFVGSITRYGIYLWLGSRNLGLFPWATLFINVSGCLVIGIVSVLVERALPFHRHIFLMLSVGFLGAFTTFSAFGLETLTLMRNQQMALAVINAGSNVIVGVAAVWFGRLIAALFLPFS